MSKRSFFQLVTGRDPEIEEYKNVLTPPAAVSNNPKTNHRAVNVPFQTESADESEPAPEEGQLTIDVYQTPDEMVIKSTIAGVKQEDLEITIAADMVTVQGVRKKDEGIPPEDYYYQELYWGPFSRSVILPHEIDTEGARAGLKDGILTIRLPKFERGRTKKLRINSA